MPWGHVTVPLDRLAEQALRDWYAAAALEYGWTRNVLLHMISGQLHARQGTAPSNLGDPFNTAMRKADSPVVATPDDAGGAR